MAYLSQKIYVPKTKYGLLNELAKIYPNDKSKHRKMKKKQLYAIYFSKRNVNEIDLEGY